MPLGETEGQGDGSVWVPVSKGHAGAGQHTCHSVTLLRESQACHWPTVTKVLCLKMAPLGTRPGEGDPEARHVDVTAASSVAEGPPAEQVETSFQFPRGPEVPMIGLKSRLSEEADALYSTMDG